MSNVAQQLAGAGIPVFPCTHHKVPAVGKGVDWRDVATLAPDQLQWPSGVIGVPIPAGSVVFDLDSYKMNPDDPAAAIPILRQQVEQALGFQLPWDQALIQITQRGGHHYAFAVDWSVRQGTNMAGVKHFDIRSAGDGFIATGEGYTWLGNGLYPLAYPAQMLPPLPQAARAQLEKVQREVATADLPEGDRDVDTIREALTHISAEDRDTWRDVMFALKHHFHDELEAGWSVFDEWSANGGGNYNIEDNWTQWTQAQAVREDGRPSITIGSVFHMAAMGGYVLPAGFDIGAAFGSAVPLGAEAQAADYDKLFDKILETGGNQRTLPELLEELRLFSCNEAQRHSLAGELHTQLNEAGNKRAGTHSLIDRVLGTTAARKAANAPGMYGKSHRDNVALFLEGHYPDNTLRRTDEEWYAYNDKCWYLVDDKVLAGILSRAMVVSDSVQDSTINSTYSLMVKLLTHQDTIGNVSPDLVLYQNGVLNLREGALSPHSPDLYTANIMPYDYSPGAQCPQWQNFLDEVFERDQDRIALLQEWFGYMITASYDFQKMMMILGPGRSGKGTIGTVLSEMVGDQNCAAGSLASFASDPYLDSLRTKPVIFIGDSEDRVDRNKTNTVIAKLKQISGHDKVDFNRKFKDAMHTKLPSRITIASNSTPKLFDDSGALGSRFLILPINVTFLDREDPHLGDKLERELEGIAMWSLEGLRRLYAQGRFTIPAASAAETEYLKEAYSPMLRFIDEVCVDDKDGRVLSCTAHQAYAAWANLHGEEPLSRKIFTSAFKDATRAKYRYGTVRSDDGRGKGFYGFRLATVTPESAGAFPPPHLAAVTQPTKH